MRFFVQKKSFCTNAFVEISVYNVCMQNPLYKKSSVCKKPLCVKVSVCQSFCT